MSVDIAAIAKALDKIAALWAEVEVAIKAETNAKRRKAMQEACRKGDLAAIKELLYGIK